MTLETSPDKKMGVGSLRSPREYDGRPPPDAGYYLGLVIPRKEEPPKKIGSPGEIVAWKNITKIVIRLLVTLTRISVNLLINPRISVNLLVKLTRISGCHGALLGSWDL